MEVLLFHNPNAGKRDVTRGRLLRALRKVGLKAAYASTKSAKFPAVLHRPADLIVIAGGDGTVAQVLTERDDGTPALLIPLGTANNIARSLGLDFDDPLDLSPVWPRGRKRRIDVWRADGPWGTRRFVESIGLGMLAHTAKRVGRKPPPETRLKHARKALSKVLRTTKPFKAEIELDGETVHVHGPMAEVLNIGWGGPALPFAADADMDDRMLEFAWVEARRCREMVAWIEGKQKGPPPLSRRRVHHLAMTWRDIPLHIDDELPKHPKKPVAITVTRDRQPAFVMVPRKKRQNRK